MDTRVLLFLVLVGCSWCCNARDLSVLQSYEKLPKGEAQNVEVLSKNDQLCAACVEYAYVALNYLSENKTQTEIISILHKSCSKRPSFKKQCIVLVDYYAPLFFSEVSSIQAEDFCRKVDLCKKDVSIYKTWIVENPKKKCDICQNVVTEALLKLKDPDTELEIIQLLLKACDSIGKTVKKCKRLVFEYAPIILVNGEEFLEKNDVCTILHACDVTTANEEQGLVGTETSTRAAS